MLMNFTIRLATIKDAKAVHKVLLAAFEEYRFYYSPEGFADTVLSEEKAKDRIKETKVYVAVDQSGKIIGTIGWQKLNESEGHIRGMGVIPRHQGKGIGSYLLQLGIRELMKRDVETIKLSVRVKNPSAIKVYQRNGFRILPERTNCVFIKDL